MYVKTLTQTTNELHTTRSLALGEDFTTINVNDIVISKNFHKQTPQAAATVLEALRDKGYETVTATFFPSLIKFQGFKTVDGNTI
jgi:hypothetical protein